MTDLELVKQSWLADMPPVYPLTPEEYGARAARDLWLLEKAVMTADAWNKSFFMGLPFVVRSVCESSHCAVGIGNPTIQAGA